jgi:hypothetical protein
MTCSRIFAFVSVTAATNQLSPRPPSPALRLRCPITYNADYCFLYCATTRNKGQKVRWAMLLRFKGFVVLMSARGTQRLHDQKMKSGRNPLVSRLYGGSDIKSVFATTSAKLRFLFGRKVLDESESLPKSLGRRPEKRSHSQQPKTSTKRCEASGSKLSSALC